MERSDAARGKYRAVQQPIRYLVGSLPLLLAIAFLAALPGTGGCSDGRAHADPEGASARGTDVGTPEAAVSAAQDRFAARRAAMVAEQLARRDISAPEVLAALGRVPRHEFVPQAYRDRAYADGPLPIGHAQTISQPYVVALMTQLVRPDSTDKALDVGTGSGYQAAILAEIVDRVYGIEIVCPLAEEAAARLDRLGYEKVTVRCGDGYAGWPEHAPFDVIILAAAPDHVPPALVEQLAPGGRLVLPVGRGVQELVLIEKGADGTVTRRDVLPVRFVPMTGAAQRR